MQKDFHYCLIKVLAKNSGFSEDDAQIIAYSSQYTDDSVEHMPFRIKNIPNALNYSRINRGQDLFDPICTAHKGIQFLSGIVKKVQMDVYIAFHFCPPLPYGGHGPYNYCCTPDGMLARLLVKNSIKEIIDAQNNDQRTQALIKLGIALHTYADNWSHQRFSGRHSAKDNDIERIAILKDGCYEAIPYFTQLKLNATPDIGHGEASHFPDYSHCKWKYEHDSSGISYSIDNTSNFLEAACSIYKILCDGNNKLNDWKKISNKIEECLSVPSDSLKEKFNKYQLTFPDIQFNYHENDWRQQALKGESFEWINFDDSDYISQTYDFNGDLKWFYFHIAAYDQRIFVQSNIRKDLI
ncbi:MAG: hypothetical protein KGZ62_05450 [Sulfurimonas sp.]|nr:hypothetical protein [Sulfurimonas sp.]